MADNNNYLLFDKFLRDKSLSLDKSFPLVLLPLHLDAYEKKTIENGKLTKISELGAWKFLWEDLSSQIEEVFSGDCKTSGYNVFTLRKDIGEGKNVLGSLVLSCPDRIWEQQQDYEERLSKVKTDLPSVVFLEHSSPIIVIWDDQCIVDNSAFDSRIIKVDIRSRKVIDVTAMNNEITGDLCERILKGVEFTKEMADGAMGYIFMPSIFESDASGSARIAMIVTFIGKVTFSIMRRLSSIVRSWGLAVERQLLAWQIRESATRSAIGSIMSRNGSHNIGSHVLSALSHNVGTMPDDRVLYQYIQHRMDYIATATTDFPKWTTPTMFVSGLMKNFYAQKHLLDYISRSEGLRAYKFQERNLDDVARMNQHGTIRIFLRKFFRLNELKEGVELPDTRQLAYDINDEPWSIYHFFGEKAKMFRRIFSTDKRVQYEMSELGGATKFLEYDERFSPDWKQDVRIAIPGGIVGQHAFYTIIENVIRNAAKHGWVAEQNLKEKDLEIYIDFGESGNKVIFTIGDNVSDVFSSTKSFWEAFFKHFEMYGVDDWKKFIAKLSIENEIKEQAKTSNTWKRIVNVLYPERAADVVGKKSKGEVSSDNDKKLSNLIIRLFVEPLDSADAEKLEHYLSEDVKGDDGTTFVLPIIYQIQDWLLRNDDELAWENFKGYLVGVVKKDEDGKEDENELGRRLILPLHHDQHRKLAQSFIRTDGTLRPENWGLAEMKISAGYLMCRDTSEIGGLTEKGNNILVPVAMPGICRNADNPHNCMACSMRDKRDCYATDSDCPLRTHRFHLGYRFRIERPRDILIVLDKNGFDKITESVQEKFIENGICFAYGQVTELQKGVKKLSIYYGKDRKELKVFNYRYVVFKNKFDETDEFYHGFGFRRISLEGELTWSLANEAKERLQKYINDIQGRNVVSDEIVQELRKAILSAWIQDLRAKSGLDESATVKLTLNVNGNENGRERGLVTTKDLLQTMFVECYHTALISFVKTPPESIGLSDTACHLIMLLSLIKVLPDAMVKPQENYGHGADYGAKEYIRAQLIDYCDKLKSGLLLSVQFVDALKSIERYVKDEDGKGDAIITRDIEAIDKNFEKAIARRLFRAKLDDDEIVRKRCEELVKFLRKIDKEELDHLLDAFHGASLKYYCAEEHNFYKSGRHSLEDNLRAVVKACSVPEEYEFDALVESLNSMFLASDVYLRKYEERIATLPEAYKHDGSEKKRKEDISSEAVTIPQIVDDLLLPKNRATSDKIDGECRIIKYSRHDRSKPVNAIYTEALSGSQSYLNALSRLVSATGNKPDELYARYAGVARLLENAFLRILIIDERVMNFVNDRSSDEMIKTFINMGIWVADIRKPQSAKDRIAVKDTLYNLEYKDSDLNEKKQLKEPAITMSGKDRQFDVLIIHQGIIDKWWAKHDHVKVKAVLNSIRKDCQIPWVVVTTGRGRPENIPDDEKVLPFSVIESALFRRYPEKLILVNTIMNLLPYGKRDKAT